jgi:hypothetical protein
MIVLEFRLKDLGYACVTRQAKTEKRPVTYKVELWDKSKFYHSKTFYNFEQAELHYWEQLKKEFL